MMLRTRKFALICVFFIGAQAQASFLGDLVGDVITSTVGTVAEGVMEGCEKLVSSVMPKSKKQESTQPIGIKLMDSLPEGSAEKVYQAIRGTAFSEIYSLDDIQKIARPGSELYTYRGALLFYGPGAAEVSEIPDRLIQYFVDAKVITRVMWQLSKDLAFEEQ